MRRTTKRFLLISRETMAKDRSSGNCCCLAWPLGCVVLYCIVLYCVVLGIQVKSSQFKSIQVELVSVDRVGDYRQDGRWRWRWSCMYCMYCIVLYV